MNRSPFLLRASSLFFRRWMKGTPFLLQALPLFSLSVLYRFSVSVQRVDKTELVKIIFQSFYVATTPPPSLSPITGDIILVDIKSLLTVHHPSSRRRRRGTSSLYKSRRDNLFIYLFIFLIESRETANFVRKWRLKWRRV